MGMFDLLECENNWVADGIGDDFKVDIQFDWKSQHYRIEKSSPKRCFCTNKWEPRQPVVISAQTGNGKNHFIENPLLKYIRDLNYRNKTNFRILIFSNRRALAEQTKNRLKNGTADDSKIYDYGDYVDVMPYHTTLMTWLPCQGTINWDSLINITIMTSKIGKMPLRLRGTALNELTKFLKLGKYLLN